MSPRDPPPGSPNPPDDPGDARHPGGGRPPPRPLLWQPDDQPRDVNLEMTLDDLDRRSVSPPDGFPRAARMAESSDVHGLGRSWRDQIFP
jgi:hypothetical protein